MAIVISVLVVLSAGIIEFGRAFMLSNMVMHAARDGARAAAVIGSAGRDPDGIFSPDPCNGGPIETRVKDQIKTVLDAVTVDAFTIACPQDLGAGNIPVVTLTITGDIPYIFNLGGGNSFAVTRSVTFRDEGRTPPPPD